MKQQYIEIQVRKQQINDTNVLINQQYTCKDAVQGVIYIYPQYVSEKFYNVSNMHRLQLSTIVYDIKEHKTIKSRYYNLQNVDYDEINNKFIDKDIYND